MKELILGGARSGKSRLAEQIATLSGKSVTYIATATANDAEMLQRIKLHQSHRDPAWQLCEEPVSLASALKTHAAADRCIIVDCLTLWISNLLCLDNKCLDNKCLENKCLENKCLENKCLDITSPENTNLDNITSYEHERDKLLNTLTDLPGHIILVSNETGMGVVPLGELTRRFCDESGILHQQLAKICDKVTLTVAGLPTILKG